jgi:hypothetical protein
MCLDKILRNASQDSLAGTHSEESTGWTTEN